MANCKWSLTALPAASTLFSTMTEVSLIPALVEVFLIGFGYSPGTTSSGFAPAVWLVVDAPEVTGGCVFDGCVLGTFVATVCGAELPGCNANTAIAAAMMTTPPIMYAVLFIVSVLMVVNVC